MGTARPVIGISMYREPASWGQWKDVQATLLPAAYSHHVSAGGGTPVLLAPFGIADDVASVVGRLDGLVIAGGADVNPSRYGRDPEPPTAGWRDDRDVSELALLNAAADLDLPTLGICRGMQMMAVHAGGTLLQHLPDVVGTDDHSPGPGAYQDNPVTTVPGTMVAALLGESALAHCHHHQSVDNHPGFRASAHSHDGIVEAFENPTRKFWVGVQWHPETGTDLRLFTALSAAATAYRTA
ncbi:gamma-glutamyl-gamma-aminobutyrate hydrolase family protein [Nakamurella antarctica]|uniref:gamma-glutamyl-gamma-aminobutyrate hydrolase family protein n=1 Tax=Nakamurella antarctica TaxID=1902245 RepID=UPI001EEFEE60|nr:gamma-glutamyl-gamma-aminobutyrate hydrolase family protein [Nakamurella antarctica]